MASNYVLVYDAAAEVLQGKIADLPSFKMKAYSGGGRGHRQSVTPAQAKKFLHAQAESVESRLATTPTFKQAGSYVRRGGTLPPGHYTCVYMVHKHFGPCIRLDMHADARSITSPFSVHAIPTAPHGHRDGFYVHGSGPAGSDGCIVPDLTEESERKRLNAAVRQFAGQVSLVVKNVSYGLPAELARGLFA